MPFIKHLLCVRQTSLVAQMVRNLPVIQETWVRSLGWEDTLQKETATHSNILIWRIPCTEDLVVYSAWSHRVRRDCQTPY